MTVQNKPGETAKSGVADAFKDFPYYKESAVHKYRGGVRCNTMQLIRDPGPGTFAG